MGDDAEDKPDSEAKEETPTETQAEQGSESSPSPGTTESPPSPAEPSPVTNTPTTASTSAPAGPTLGGEAKSSFSPGPVITEKSTPELISKWKSAYEELAKLPTSTKIPFEESLSRVQGYEILRASEISILGTSKTFSAKKHGQPIAVRIYNLKGKGKDHFHKCYTDFMFQVTSLVGTNNPYFVPHYDFFHTDEKVYFFIEHMNNSSIANYVKKNGAVSEKQGKKWAKSILAGLMFFYDHGVSLRKVQSDKMLIDGEMNAKIGNVSYSIPFWDVKNNAYVSCHPQNIKSSLIAPETRNSDFNPIVADVWCFGCVVFSMLTKRLPYDYKLPNYTAKVQFGRAMNRYATKLSPESRDFLCKTLEEDPSKRIALSQLSEHPWLK